MKQTPLQFTVIFCPLFLLISIGCATTSTSNTARTASEQLLISSAIDRALSDVQFADFKGYKVHVSEKYLDAVDKTYLVGAIRHKVLTGGGSIAEDVANADLVLEPRSGGIGTDSQESFIGIPSLGMPGLPIELPEIKLASRQTQLGTAKIGMVCYDAKSGSSLGLGGDTTALTHNSDTYVLGVGPFRNGSVVDTRRNAVGFTGVGDTMFAKTVPAKFRNPVDVIGPANTPAGNLGSGMAVERIATLPKDAASK